MLYRSLVIGLLVLWCGLGAAVTVAALTGPGVWWNHRDAHPADIVGTPLRGAAEVSAVRALLNSQAPSDERWLLVLPPLPGNEVLLYIRFQLAHLEYPRRVDVRSVDGEAIAGDYAGVITVPGITLPPLWKLTAEHAGFGMHRRAGS